MAIFTIQSPDGREIDIEAADQATALQGAQTWAQQNPVKKPTSQGLGFDKSFGRIVDNAALAMDGGLRSVGIPMDAINRSMTGSSTREQVASNRAGIAQREQTARPGVVGQVAGSTLAMAPMMAATKNPFMLGGAEGALSSEGGSPGRVATDAAMGAGLGYVGGRAVEAVGNIFAPVVEPAVRRLVDKGVHLTPGMRQGAKAMAREDKLASRPVVGAAIAAGRARTSETFNRAAVDEALAPLGKRVPTPIRAGHDAVDWAHTEVGRAYDVVVPNLAVQIDGKQFASNIASAAQALPAKQQKELQRVISVNLKNGTLAGQDLKRAQGEIRRLASTYGTSASAEDRLLGDALGSVDDELTEAMLTQNPKWAPELQKANAAYRGLRIVEDAASRADDGILSTGQLKQAVRRGDRSKGKSQTARGKAFMQEFSEDARAVIPPVAPNGSGTAAHQMAGNPFAIGAGAVDAAAYRGREAYSNFLLAPRPKAAIAVGQGVRRLQRPGTVAVVSSGRAER